MTIITADCVEAMAAMPADSVDALVTDPPYGLEFMGKEWDRLLGRGGDTARAGVRGEWVSDRPQAYRAGMPAQQWHQRWATEALRVAKPGAYLLAFGGTRTYHRLACAIEDAGWIIRDCLVWAYAQGFPKGRANLKPAWEPIVMARKPGPLRELAIDACRIGIAEGDAAIGGALSANGRGEAVNYGGGGYDGTLSVNTLGRWPANVIATDAIFEPGVPGVIVPSVSGTMTAWQSSYEASEPSPTASLADSAEPMWSPGELDASYPSFADEPAAMPAADLAIPIVTRRRGTGCSAGTTAPRSGINGSTARSGRMPTAQSRRATSSTTETGTASTTDSPTWSASPERSTSPITSRSEIGPAEWPGSESLSDDAANWRRGSQPAPAELSYSRYFLIPKADRSDREPNAYGRLVGGLEERAHPSTLRGEGGGLGGIVPQRANIHPTVKPVELMRHLVRLVTPTCGTVLDPFLGSGSTAIAAEMEGFAWIGIEREPEYVAIAEARLAGVQRGLGLSESVG